MVGAYFIIAKNGADCKWNPHKGVVDWGVYTTLPAMSSKVFGQAFFKKLAGRGEFAKQTHSEAGESPRRSPQRAKLPQRSESEEK